METPAESSATSRVRPSAARRSWGSFVASAEGVPEEARTRGFAAQAFAGCALNEGQRGLRYDAVWEVSRIQHPGGALDTDRSESQQAPVAKTAVPVCLGPTPRRSIRDLQVSATTE
jgi:hypothetical protein